MSSSQNGTHINIEALGTPAPDAYHGYKVLSERDLMIIQNKHTQPENGKLSPSQKTRPIKMIILSIVLFVSFALIVAWQILVSNCQVTRLCSMTDMSSQQVSPYLFRTFRFFVPSGLVWIGLSIGSFIMFAASVLTIKLSKNSISLKPLEFVGLYIRQASSIILLGQHLVIIVPTFIIFLIVGVRINWSTAGCFSTGTMMCTMTAHIATAICTRSNTHTNIQMALASKAMAFHHSLSRAFLFSVVILLSTIGLASLATAGSYLLYSDIQALSAFIAGSSFASLFLRSSSTLSFDAIVTAFNFKPIFREVIPPNAVTVVSAGVSVVTGVASDIFDSFSITTICTAFLGAGLPYFANNQYALCVFNHLNIDKECGPFGYPEDVSFASVICRAANFYMKYPSLELHTSVSQFLSVPFVLLGTTLVVYFFGVFCVTISEMMIRKKRSETVPALEPVKRRMLCAMVLCAVLLAASSSAVFFGMFGASTDFQKSELHGFGKEFPRMVLKGVEDQCSLGAALSSTDVMPTGIEKREENYSPLFPSGTTHGSAKGVPMRLFATHCTGIFAGLLIILMSSLNMASSQARTENSATPSFITFQRYSSSFMLQIPIAAVLLVTVMLSFRLFGGYGVGLASIGFVSMSSASLVGKIMGTMLLNAVATQFLVKQDPSADKFRNFVLDINRVMSTSAQMVTNAATTLMVLTAFFGLLQKSGIWFSPRTLAGTVDLPASNLKDFVDGVQLASGSILASTMVGAAAPVLLGALFLAACFRSGLAVYVARRVNVYLSASMSPSFVAQTVKLSFQECMFLLLMCVLLPLCIGFGFGQHGVAAFVVAFSSVSYMLGAVLSGEPIKRRMVVPQWDDYLMNTIKQNTGACIQAGVKVCVSLGVLMCTLMKENGASGWIGAVLFCVSGVFIIVAAVLSRVRFVEMVVASGLHGDVVG